MKAFDDRPTTKNFQIGSPEAEAESVGSSKIKLFEVFEDFLEIIPEIDNEKYIITGRKGSGKTAIGEYLYYLSTQEPNKFVDFIRKEDVDIEKIIQVGLSLGHEIQEELLFKWIILIRFLKLLTQNESIKSTSGMKDLRHFITRNIGYVDIKKFETMEIMKSDGFEVRIENLKSFAAKYGKDLTIKSARAPFYKLIPFLEDAILTVMKQDTNNNKYLIFFDDLDIGISLSNENNRKTLINLLRIAKYINNNLFGKNSIDAKVIILLRNDITRYLKRSDADTAKIISSYEIPISWFENEILRSDENSLKIKKFIDKRIKLNFEKNGIPLTDPNNPWNSLIEDDSRYNKGSFKYIIDHTFCKPRDLILFFKPLPDFNFHIPLSFNDVNKLIGKYSSEAMDEINNELIIHISHEEWDSIFKACKYFVNDATIKYDLLSSRLSLYKFDKTVDEIIEMLYTYSLIGNKETNSSIVYFKHREQRDQALLFDQDLDIVIHYIFKVYLHNNVHSKSY